MDLLNLAVRIFAQDEASPEVENVSQNIIGKLAGAAKTAATALAGAFATKKVIEFGKAAFDAYADFEQLAGGTAKIFDELDQAKILDDAGRAFTELNMSASEYLESINTVGATFAQTMGDEKAYEAARTGMKAISDFASGTGADIGLLNEKYKLITRSAGSYQSIADQFAGILPQTSQDFLDQAKAAGFLSDEYTKLTDVPVAEYQEAVTKMLEKGVADAGFAGNTLKESLTTISGSIAATKSAWQNLVLEFGKPDANIAARISDMFLVLFGGEQGGGLVRNIAKEVGVIARNMVTGLGEAVGMAADWLVSNGARVLREGIEGMVQSAANFGDLISSLPKINLTEALFSSDGGALSGLGNMVTDITEIIREWWPDIQGAVGETWDNIRNLVIEYGPQVLEAIGTILSGIGEWIITNTPDIVGSIYETFLAINEWIVSNGPMILETIGGIIDSVVQWIWEHIPEILAAVGEMFMNIVNAIIEHGPTILSSMAEMVGTVIGYLIEHAAEFFTAAAEWISQMVQSIQENGVQVPDWFSQLPQMILDALGDLSGLLVDTGIQIVNGLIEGITSTIGGAATALMDGIGGAVEGILGFLDIGSPSKLFNWIGRMSMEGLAGGIDDAAAKAQKATSSAVQGVYDAASGTIDVSMAPSGNNDILTALGEIRDGMNMSVYLDGKTLVGGIAPTMNTALGGMY